MCQHKELYYSKDFILFGVSQYYTEYINEKTRIKNFASI